MAKGLGCMRIAVSCGLTLAYRLLLPLCLEAEELALIKIRTISAQKIEAKQKVAGETEASVLQLPDTLSDIAEKLKELPFNSFKLHTQDEVKVGLKDIRELRLSGGDAPISPQTLKLKLLGLNRGKVCLWMNWRESEGEEILESRVHFKQGEQFVTGTEAKNGVGMLVVLQVTKQE